MTEPLRLRAPSSKSATQRALVLAALAPGESVLRSPLDCDDSRALAGALQALGAEIERSGDLWRVRGGRLRSPAAALDCGNAGTCVRFLAALAPLLPGPLLLDARPQLRRRPVSEIGQGLAALGCAVRWLEEPEHPPLRVAPPASLPRRVELDASRSSQFLSGLLMAAAPLGGLELVPRGTVISAPYVELTLSLMARFGCAVLRGEGGSLQVPAQDYQPRDLEVEGDWSGGAMLWVGAWLAGRALEVPNLDPASPQGDRVIRAFLAELDQPREHVFDLSGCPDLITPLAVACAFAAQPSTLVGVRHARIKESDRIAATVQMLGACGLQAEERADGLRIEPAPGPLRAATIVDYEDHRVAMAAGLLSLRIPGVVAQHPACVAKSWPGFWQDLEALRCS